MYEYQSYVFIDIRFCFRFLCRDLDVSIQESDSFLGYFTCDPDASASPTNRPGEVDVHLLELDILSVEESEVNLAPKLRVLVTLDYLNYSGQYIVEGEVRECRPMCTFLIYSIALWKNSLFFPLILHPLSSSCA